MSKNEEKVTVGKLACLFYFLIVCIFVFCFAAEAQEKIQLDSEAKKLMVIRTTTLGAKENSTYGECIDYGFDAVSFAGKNDMLILRCRCSLIGSPALWILSDLKGNLSRFTILDKATSYAIKDYPSYSPDSKLITFSSGEKDHRNIYVMNADGTNVRQLTHNYNESPLKVGEYITYVWNDLPSFSPDGKKIIFVRSQKKPLKPKYYGDPMPPVRWDVYEVEIAMGKERQLTNYGFPEISSPYYLADGKRFIFSAEIYAADQEETVLNTDEINVYDRKYKQNLIFIMDGVNNQLRPVLKNGIRSQWPVIGKDDMILFSSTVNPDGSLWKENISTDLRSALFLYKAGKIKRLMEGVSHNRSTAFSPDGSRIAFITSIINIDGTNLTEINTSRKAIEKIMKSWLNLTK